MRPHVLSAALVAFILCSVAALAEEACTLDFSKFHSPLISEDKAFRKIGPEKRDQENRTVTQAGTLKSGETVEFKGGGCAHVGYTFTFSGVKGAAKDPAKNLRLATALLAKTPGGGEKKAVLVKALEDALAKGASANGGSSLALPCGDASCDIEVLGPGKLAISYSFAL